jgi:hypothetical protein
MLDVDDVYDADDDCGVYENADVCRYCWHSYANADVCVHADGQHLNDHANADAYAYGCHGCGGGDGVAVVDDIDCRHGCARECVDVAVAGDRLFFVSVCCNFCSRRTVLLNRNFQFAYS